MTQLFPILRSLWRMGPIQLALTTAVLVSSLATEVWATDGFDRLTWGMSRDEVSAAYQGQVRDDDEPRGAPTGSAGSRLIIESGSRLFDEPVELSCFFDTEGLVSIRLQYVRPRAENIEQLVNWYRPHWGEPVHSVDRENERGLRKRVWAWPWEGVSLRAVEESGAIKYQRVDFSRLLTQEWTQLDSALCSLLPASSSCPEPDTACPQLDSSMPQGKRSQRIEVADTPAEIACSYQDYKLVGNRLTLEGPSERTNQWFQRILQGRLGEPKQQRSDTRTHARIDSSWSSHGIEFREVRKAAVRTSSGWTGPLIQLRIKRDLRIADPESTPR